MRTRHALLAALALAALSGCDAKPSAAPPPAAPAPAPSSSVDSGTLDATSAYLAELGKLDPRLVADRAVALDNGSTICIDIEERKPAAEQERNIATRFAVSPAEARQILDVATNNLCLQ